MNILHIAGITVLAVSSYLLFTGRQSKREFLRRPALSQEELLELFSCAPRSDSGDSILEVLTFLSRECGVPHDKLRPSDKLRELLGPPKQVDDELHYLWDITANRPRLRETPTDELGNHLRQALTVKDYCNTVIRLENPTGRGLSDS